MFDILVYLFETYIHNDVELMVDHDELTDELTRAGFHKGEIYKTLDWLENLAELQNLEVSPYESPISEDSMRQFTNFEMTKLDSECRGFLLHLEQICVLDPMTREMVIDSVMAVDSPTIELQDLKWIVLMVLFNLPGNEAAYQQMEEIIFHPEQATIH